MISETLKMYDESEEDFKERIIKKSVQCGNSSFLEFVSEMFNMVEEVFSDVPQEIWDMDFTNKYSMSKAVLREKEVQRKEFISTIGKDIHDTFYAIFLYGEVEYVTFNLSGRKRTGIIKNESSKSVEVELIEFSKGIKRKRERKTGIVIKRHKKKHQVRVYPYGIRPIN